MCVLTIINIKIQLGTAAAHGAGGTWKSAAVREACGATAERAFVRCLCARGAAAEVSYGSAAEGGDESEEENSTGGASGGAEERDFGGPRFDSTSPLKRREGAGGITGD